MAEREINNVYITILGDPSVGMPGDQWELRCFFYLEDDPETVRAARQAISEMVEKLWGEKPSIMFDYEQEAMMRMETEAIAAQLEEERLIAKGMEIANNRFSMCFTSDDIGTATPSEQLAQAVAMDQGAFPFIEDLALFNARRTGLVV